MVEYGCLLLICTSPFSALSYIIVTMIYNKKRNKTKSATTLVKKVNKSASGYSATPVFNGDENNRYLCNLEALCILQPPLILTCLYPLAVYLRIFGQCMVLILRRLAHPLE
jgi:hypothetical protein